MSAAYIERQNAYFASLDSLDLEEESSSSEEEEASSSSEEEEQEQATDDAEGERQAQQQLELCAAALSDAAADEDGTDEHGALSDEDDELVLIGDGGSTSTVYGRGGDRGSRGSAELFDAVVGAGSAALSAALRGQKRRHTASGDALTLTDVVDDSCELAALSPVADDRPSSPDVVAASEGEGSGGGAKKMRLVLPPVAARTVRAPKPRGSNNRVLLLKAISKGDEAAVEALIAKGVSLDFYTAEGQTPLSTALTVVAIDRVASVTGLLLRRGVDPNQTVTVAYEDDDSERAGPLELALARGLPELVLLLLKHGATPQRVPRADEYKLMQYAREGRFTQLAADSLRVAMRSAVATADAAQVAALAAHGADVEDVDERGRSLLHRALSAGCSRADSSRVPLVKALCEAGAETNRACLQGVLPLCYPVLRSDTELVGTLQGHGADMSRAVAAIQNS